MGRTNHGNFPRLLVHRLPSSLTCSRNIQGSAAYSVAGCSGGSPSCSVLGLLGWSVTTCQVASGLAVMSFRSVLPHSLGPRNEPACHQ